MMQQTATCHSMQRRMVSHNYSLPGIYHITLHVADRVGQPLGQVEGLLDQPDDTLNGPHVELTPVGQMVRDELLSSMSTHYPMVSVDTFVIMPEHLHALIEVKKPLISRNGRSTHLGQVIAGFKKGCNRRYWAMTEQDIPTGEPLETLDALSGSPAEVTSLASPALSGSPAEVTLPAGKRVPSDGTTGRPPLFAFGYCDVQPITAEQLATQRAYIKANPRSRLLRTSHRDTLMPSRGAFVTALTPSALRGYLQRECLSKHATPEALSAIECHLLIADGKIALDTYGNRQLLKGRLLPVVCHRKDKNRLGEQKARCMEEAANGAIMVSARISLGEQEIMNEAVNHGYPVIIINDNGFPECYHPSMERIERCAADKLLIVTPWQYQYRGKNEQVTIPFCKAMNCVAQAICRLKDDWWKNASSASECLGGLPAEVTSPAAKI